MFSAPRFIAIDDNKEHLNAIVLALQAMGTSCFGIRFDPAEDIPKVFSGVRCLFVDLHLITGLPGTDDQRHFTNIASIIENNIEADCGPYVLVVWTEFPDRCDALRDFLDERLQSAKPLAVLGLPKERFINVASGTVTDAVGLREGVLTLVNDVPQLAALLAWESDVQVAAGNTLSSLLSLVPADKRSMADYPKALDTILSRLACATVGKFNVERDPRSAVVQALLPILADRITNRWSDSGLDVWKAAVTLHGEAEPRPDTVEQAAKVNRMLHLALAAVEKVSPSDWGSVVKWPYEWDEATIANYLGVPGQAELYGELKIKEADRVRCTPVLVRVGAVCDAAQKRPGPISFLLGFEVPFDAKPKSTPKQSIWVSPILLGADGTNAFHLYVNARFAIVAVESQCLQWTSKYRLREQLLMNLIWHSAEYGSRPGIVKVDGV